MLTALFSLFGILITILFVIGTHEAAHFVAARCLGVKVLRFSIGFGKKIFSFHDRSGTEYVLALIPLGGYVKMLDETEDTVPEQERHLAYNQQPYYKKFLIVLAGPACNIVCALLLYWVVFMVGFVTIKPIIGSITKGSIAAEAGLQSQQEIIQIDHHDTHTWTGILFRMLAHIGDHDHLTLETKKISTQEKKSYILDLSHWQINALMPDPLTSLGIIPYDPPIPLVIGVISEKSPAFQAGLQIGDKIIAVNQTRIKNWNELITFVAKHPSQVIAFTIERKGKLENISVESGYKRNWLFQKSGYLGIGPTFKLPQDLLNTLQFGPIDAARHAWQEVSDFTYFNLLIFDKLFTGKLSLQSLGGPITIFETAGEALNVGFVAFIGFLAFLSLSIGLINLLPIPGLDGGHLFIQTIEFIIRRPVPEKIQLGLYRLGFIFIIFILVQALINDLLRLY